MAERELQELLYFFDGVIDSKS